MKILAIDPGTRQSGWAIRNNGELTAHGVEPNETIRERLRAASDGGITLVAIETMEDSYGKSIDENTTLTLEETGVFFYIAEHAGIPILRCPRRKVKKQICGTLAAKDADVKQELISRIGPEGNKKAPGPTYGLKSHSWQALASAVYAEETYEPLCPLCDKPNCYGCDG